MFESEDGKANRSVYVASSPLRRDGFVIFHDARKRNVVAQLSV